MNSKQMREMYKEHLDDVEIRKIDVSEMLRTAIFNPPALKLSNLAADILKALEILEVSSAQKQEFCGKLTQYCFVDQLCDFRPGRYIRWIRLDSPHTISTGGHLIELKFSNTGTNVMVRRAGNIVMKYAFDKCLSFQRLTDDEMLIYMANDIAENSSADA